MSDKKTNLSRRAFLGRTAAIAALPYIVPASVLGRDGAVPPSERIVLGGIGIGNRGSSDLQWMLPEKDVQFVATCDPQRQRREKVKQMVDTRYGNSDCKLYADIREFLATRTDIDAVLSTTGDRWHALAAIMAMRAGKDVYCEKPSSLTIAQGQAVVDAARRYGRVYQTGTQRLSEANFVFCIEMARGGRLGKLHTAYAAIPHGEAVLSHEWLPAVPEPPKEVCDWDAWLGPCPWRPYNSAYAPFNWRGWWHFGTGALGDMGCHIMDMPVWALELGHPTSVEANFTAFEANESAPAGSIVTYEFPARGSKPPVRLTWSDGGLMPPKPKELEWGMPGTGSLLVGSKGKIVAEEGGTGRLIPEAAMKAYQRPPKTIKRVSGHYSDFIEAVLGGDEASSNFGVAGPLTEIVLLGNVAIQAGRNVRLEWDGPNMTVTNVAAANKFVRRQYRQGWTLPIS